MGRCRIQKDVYTGPRGRWKIAAVPRSSARGLESDEVTRYNALVLYLAARSSREFVLDVYQGNKRIRQGNNEDNISKFVIQINHEAHIDDKYINGLQSYTEETCDHGRSS